MSWSVDAAGKIEWLRTEISRQFQYPLADAPAGLADEGEKETCRRVKGMIDQCLVPRAGEFLIEGSGGADKFVNSNLDQGLKAKGIKTVIVTGTSAQGAVVGTSNGAALDKPQAVSRHCREPRVAPDPLAFQS